MNYNPLTAYRTIQSLPIPEFTYITDTHARNIVRKQEDVFYIETPTQDYKKQEGNITTILDKVLSKCSSQGRFILCDYPLTASMVNDIVSYLKRGIPLKEFVMKRCSLTTEYSMQIGRALQYCDLSDLEILDISYNPMNPTNFLNYVILAMDALPHRLMSGKDPIYDNLSVEQIRELAENKDYANKLDIIGLAYTYLGSNSRDGYREEYDFMMTVKKLIGVCEGSLRCLDLHRCHIQNPFAFAFGLKNIVNIERLDVGHTTFSSLGVLMSFDLPHLTHLIATVPATFTDEYSPSDVKDCVKLSRIVRDNPTTNLRTFQLYWFDNDLDVPTIARRDIKQDTIMTIPKFQVLKKYLDQLTRWNRERRDTALKLKTLENNSDVYIEDRSDEGVMRPVFITS